MLEIRLFVRNPIADETQGLSHLTILYMIVMTDEGRMVLNSSASFYASTVSGSVSVILEINLFHYAMLCISIYTHRHTHTLLAFGEWEGGNDQPLHIKQPQCVRYQIRLSASIVNDLNPVRDVAFFCFLFVDIIAWTWP